MKLQFQPVAGSTDTKIRQNLLSSGFLKAWETLQTALQELQGGKRSLPLLLKQNSKQKAPVIYPAFQDLHLSIERLKHFHDDNSLAIRKL